MDASSYSVFRKKKPNGRYRVIHVPSEELKEKQRAFLENEYRTGIGPGKYATGFVRKKSTKDHAVPHIGKAFVVEVDIKDCFHSVTRQMIMRAWVLEKLLPSEIESRAMNTKGMDWRKLPPPIGLLDIGLIERTDGSTFAPMGGVLSPHFANLVLKWLDFKIAVLLKRQFPNGDAAYTRYADNLVFSSDQKLIIPLAKYAVERILNSGGFETNKAKFKVMRKTGRQRVCGIVINRKLSIPKDKRREIRARVHNLFMDCLNGKEVDVGEYLSVRGYLAYAHHIDPSWVGRFSDRMLFVGVHLKARKKIAL